jgi:hypothetical protein
MTESKLSLLFLYFNLSHNGEKTVFISCREDRLVPRFKGRRQAPSSALKI